MPDTEQRHALREHFIEAFVKELISNSYNVERDKELQQLEMEEQLSNSNMRPVASTPIKTSLPKPQLQQIQLSPQKFQSQPFPLPTQPVILPASTPTIPLPPPYQPAKLKPGQKVDSINLGKLATILQDPSVFTVECPGPYKNLLINRSGSIQASAIAFTPEEISTLMQNISDHTRIPLTPGIFRAAVQDLLVTAVLSDFVGTRFMIQKRNPFQRY